jgi:hypothetical protein
VWHVAMDMRTQTNLILDIVRNWTRVTGSLKKKSHTQGIPSKR